MTTTPENGSRVGKLKQLLSLQGLSKDELSKKLLSLEMMKDIQLHQDQMALLEEDRRHQRNMNRWMERKVDAVNEEPEDMGDIKIGDTFVIQEPSISSQGGTPRERNTGKDALGLAKKAAIAAALMSTGGLGAAGMYALGQYLNRQPTTIEQHGRDTDTRYSIEVLPGTGKLLPRDRNWNP